MAHVYRLVKMVDCIHPQAYVLMVHHVTRYPTQATQAVRTPWILYSGMDVVHAPRICIFIETNVAPVRLFLIMFLIDQAIYLMGNADVRQVLHHRQTDYVAGIAHMCAWLLVTTQSQ